MNILEAIKDPNLFREFLEDKEGSLTTWRPWFQYLKCLYGLPIKKDKDRKLVKLCTGRDYDTMPSEGFKQSLVITGRRCGKSRVAAVVGAYSASLAGYEDCLAPGEQGLVVVTSPTKKQSNNLRNYLDSCFSAPMLADLVANEKRADGFDLTNGIGITILAGDFKTVRGYTIVAAIVDEAAFLGVEEANAAKSDTELINALKPSLALTDGLLCVITTPYAKRGYCWNTYRKHWANPDSNVLVWNATSQMMNSTLKARVVEDALIEDYARARSEYFGEFRDDVCQFLDRATIERLVVKDRKELQKRAGTYYQAFVDVSGGRSDSSCLAVGHREGRTAVLDFIKEYKSPCSPEDVCVDMREHLNRYGVRKVTGDNYGAEWVQSTFRRLGIKYSRCLKPKRELYSEVLGALTSQKVELLDHLTLVNQLAALERRTGSYGKDIIDHPQTGGARDDVANAACGVVYLLHTPRLVVGRL